MKNYHLQDLIFGVWGWYLSYAALKSLLIIQGQCLSNFTRPSQLLWPQFRQNTDDMEQYRFHYLFLIPIISSICSISLGWKTISTTIGKMLITFRFLLLLSHFISLYMNGFLFDLVLLAASALTLTSKLYWQHPEYFFLVIFQPRCLFRCPPVKKQLRSLTYSQNHRIPKKFSFH